ncbi:MAG: glycoside hydrolase family 2 [Halanaerobiaceae bacterium]|nr:glycoside hydrolase family 2 [Halanaerobiaceae bacterium]
MKTAIPRPEYPRLDFARTEWLNLNGIWDFEFDDNEIGELGRWYENREFSMKILVPFSYHSEKSGLGIDELHEVMWYKRKFQIPPSWKGKRIFLNFGAVDYYTRVWINGKYIGSHKGGYLPFKFDISRFLEDDNTIVVKVEDRYDTVQPRGKQYWKQKPDRCWYIANSGIWQTVWLETVGEISFDMIKITPDIDKSCALAEVYLDKKPENMSLKMDLYYNKKHINTIECDINERISKHTINIKEEDEIDEIHYWTPSNPNLYDVEFSLIKDGQVVDSVKTYFGMRKISIKEDMILLNNRPFYQKLILDQGYWPESLLTPPSDEAIKYDIEMVKKMGFNGVRKHQKIEDPRFYYWADKLGLLVWGEMPSAYNFNSEEIENIAREYREFINRDYNHPSIIVWVPLNESWGVRNIISDPRQQNFARMLYYLTKAEDNTRLVSTNDGWEQVKSDINAIHDYISEGKDFYEKYQDPDSLFKGNASSRMLYAEGERYEGQPVIITEFGGIALASDIETATDEKWGYGYGVDGEKGLLERFEGLIKAIYATSYIKGFCYTQLTDVMQEVNGLMTMKREMKADINRIREILGAG